jgi:hypothetical protein
MNEIDAYDAEEYEHEKKPRRARKSSRTTFTGSFPTTTEIRKMTRAGGHKDRNLLFTLPTPFRKFSGLMKDAVNPELEQIFYFWCASQEGDIQPPQNDETIQIALSPTGKHRTDLTDFDFSAIVFNLKVDYSHFEADRRHGYIVVRLQR